jgi:hypothetical protein
VFNWFDEVKASVEAGIKSGIEAGFQSLAETFKDGLGGLLQIPEPAEPYQQIRSFCSNSDRPITQDGVSIEQDSWKIESYGEKKVLLFEVAEPNLPECLLLCQAQVKTAHLYQPAKLALSAQNAVGWIYSQNAAVEGTTSWHLLQVRFHYKQAQFSGAIRVSIEFEGGGVLWLKDVQVMQAAVKPPAT